MTLANKQKKEDETARKFKSNVKKEQLSPRRKQQSDDFTSPRPKDSDSLLRRQSDDVSPSRRARQKSEDASPPRRPRRQNDDASPPRRARQKSEDVSPPRRTRRESDDTSSPRRIRPKSDDLSPPRKSRRGDLSVNPPVRKMQSEDNSPRRKSKSDKVLSPRRNIRMNSSSPGRRIGSEDNSPPRRRKRDEDLSPPRKRQKDLSPVRRREKSRDGSQSSKRGRNESASPPRKGKQSRWNRSESPQSTAKMKKTLDGKAAGLQHAKDLAVEMEKFKQRENSLFRNLSAEQSGVNASTVLRDKKTGKIRNIEEEQEEQRRKQEEEDKNKEKYSKWGRGLKQVEDINEKIAQDLHEMNKPLARYADDEDLERYLKEQEREDDPMLAYIRKKKKKDAVASGKPMKPTYEGEFMPNRFGIRPGYRWDGVDRSNGYEKKWFEVQNAKRAQQEDVYKWSTEDM